ncbi:FCSD flavin-binding domain-containing protein [Azohydromonas caseinilytica]|uniref:FAD-dependent oxidoreductase n=1 Tax=Azohydromonas caseinilytica TaxID=2728836 RepID=A0A848FBV3_9BURK|nr:FCSD flavin-binding domain-containing protein [Azohydromonas caseinilytica]NML16215.1 FAD-dependent oxidoreductase [Azohydromonas caseinilytica]
MDPSRRRWLQAAGAAGLLNLTGCASTTSTPGSAHVLVVGGGWGGATAARYLRLFSGNRLQVTLVEPEPALVSCPHSNLVLAGHRTLADLTFGYEGLERLGVRRVRDRVTSLDFDKREARLASGDSLRWDKLILSPGVELMRERIDGLPAAHAAGRVLQAWKAGPETQALRAQLQAMPDGGVFVLTIPEAPFRCPPGPYERACLVADYFKREKPKSKVLVFDANPEPVSKAALFKRVWAERYAGIVEYRPSHRAVAVSADGREVEFELGERERGDVLNVLPDMRAGDIAAHSGLAKANGRWCEVDFLDFSAKALPKEAGVHLLGDAVLSAPLMPKSAHMANAHAKVAAAAVVASLSGWDLNPAPVLTNTCYSWVDGMQAMHVASVHGWDAAQRTFTVVPGGSGVSVGASEEEGHYAVGWLKAMRQDALAGKAAAA